MSQILVDCDPGVDDALALYALFASEEVAIQGITTVFGNVTVRQATRNVARLLHLLPVRLLPRVGEGADQPLTGSRLPKRLVHGQDGLGDIRIPLISVKRPLIDSTSLITGLLAAGQLETIIALAPLTNLAHGFVAAPTSFRRLREIVVMGGVMTEQQPRATEFNLASDPAAGRCLLNSGVFLRWVPWDVAASVTISQDAAERFGIAHPKSPLASVIAQLIVSTVRRRGDGRRAAFPDAVAAMLAMRPSLGQWEPQRLTLEGHARTGRVRCEQGPPNTTVCRRVDEGGVMELLWGLWERLVTRANNAVDS